MSRQILYALCTKKKMAERTSWAAVQRTVNKKIKTTTIQELLKACEEASLDLWGEKKGKDFVKQNLYIALYHDLTGHGYCFIEKHTKQWYKLTAKSISHNTKIIRFCLKSWALNHIVLGKSQDWNSARQRLRFRNP